ncbi:MAG: hypothetical protein AAF600_10395 [Bacteroidota bacterium]
MSLLDRIQSIFKKIRPGIILMIPVFLGCETSEDLGIEYDLDSNANVKFIEFTLPSTNIYVDSLRTDGENRVIVGNYHDDIGGEIATEGYFQFSYEGGPLSRAVSTDNEPDPVDTLHLDSIVLLLETQATVPFTGTINQDLKVFTLTDSLISSAIYLSSLQLERDEEISSFTREVNVVLDTIYRFRLSNSFSSDLFNLIGEITEDPDQSVSTSTFKSLGLISSDDSEGFVSFDLASDTSKIYIYSSPIELSSGQKDTTYVTSFRLTNKNYSYINRNNATFGSLEDGAEINLLDGNTIIDPLFGISTKISLAELVPFFDENNRIIINNAILSFIHKNQTERDTLENFYSFYYKNGSFNGSGLITDPFSSLVMSDNAFLGGQSLPAISALNEDKDELITSTTLFFQTLYTDYIEDSETSDLLIRDESSDVVSLVDLITLSSLDVSLQRSIFGPDDISLRIYYTEVN